MNCDFFRLIKLDKTFKNKLCLKFWKFMISTDFFFNFQDGENGQIKIEHLSDQDVNQDQFQESNSDLILDRTRAEPRNNHNNANNTNTFEEKTVIRPLPQDIIVSIKDENSRSSTCSSHAFTNPETKTFTEN